MQGSLMPNRLTSLCLHTRPQRPLPSPRAAPATEKKPVFRGSWLVQRTNPFKALPQNHTHGELFTISRVVTSQTRYYQPFHGFWDLSTFWVLSHFPGSDPFPSGFHPLIHSTQSFNQCFLSVCVGQAQRSTMGKISKASGTPAIQEHMV